MEYSDLAQMKQRLMAGAQANQRIAYSHSDCLNWDTRQPHRRGDRQTDRQLGSIAKA